MTSRKRNKKTMMMMMWRMWRNSKMNLLWKACEIINLFKFVCEKLIYNRSSVVFIDLDKTRRSFLFFVCCKFLFQQNFKIYT